MENENEDVWLLLETTNDGFRPIDSLIIFEGSFEDCLSKYVAGKNFIVHKKEFNYIT